MKKKLLLLLPYLAIISIWNNAAAQCGNTALQTIAANQVKAAVLNAGDLFWDGENAAFITPFSPGFLEVPALHSSGLWVGGYDENGQLRLAAQTLGRKQGKFDYWPGPIDDNTGEPVVNGCENFDRIWKVRRSDVQLLISDFEEDGVVDQPVPASLLSWPGKGNPHFESLMNFVLPNQNLAPFFDRNGNGIYEPLNGEYPVLDPAIPDILPDELLWCVFNDLQNEHEQSGGQPLGIEVQLLVYAFNCEESPVLNHSIFTKHIITNKSNDSLSDVYAGFWVDGQIGCYLDDFFGCDTLLNTAYFYNEDNTDGHIGCICLPADLPALCQNPPVQSTTMLNHKMDFLTYHETILSFCDPPIVVFGPQVDTQYYNFLTGRWWNGTRLTYGSDGYNPNSNDYVNYAFFDNPNDPLGWSLNNSIFFTCDKKIIMSAGVGDFLPGENYTIDMAYSFHQEPEASNLENVNVALAAIPELQNFYNNDFNTGCTQLQVCQSDCVWPGDADNSGFVRNDDLLYTAVGSANFQTGPPRAVGSYAWLPQEAIPWSDTFQNGANIKHADCNGDGQIDTLDFGLIDYNYRLHVPGIEETEEPSALIEGQLYADSHRDTVSVTDFQVLKKFVRINLELGTETQPFQDVRGVSFTVKFDTTYFTSYSSYSSLSSLEVGEYNFIGNPEDVFAIKRTFFEEGRVDFAICRKDGMPVTGYGKIATFGLFVRDDFTTLNPDGKEPLSFNIVNAKALLGNDSIVPLGAMSDTVWAVNVTLDPTVAAVERMYSQKVTIVPNPNSGEFTLLINSPGIIYLEIFDLNGRHVFSEMIPQSVERHSVDLGKKVAKGMYFIRISEESGGSSMQKLIVN